MLSGLKSRITRALGNMFGQFREPNPVKALKENRNPKRLRWGIKMWTAPKGRSFFGPVGVPDANAWVSRQTCRRRLRALMFQMISQKEPLMSRAHRRRWARAAAGLEYISMMEDKTHMVANERELLRAN